MFNNDKPLQSPITLAKPLKSPITLDKPLQSPITIDKLLQSPITLEQQKLSETRQITDQMVVC